MIRRGEAYLRRGDAIGLREARLQFFDARYADGLVRTGDRWLERVQQGQARLGAHEAFECLADAAVLLDGMHPRRRRWLTYGRPQDAEARRGDAWAKRRGSGSRRALNVNPTERTITVAAASVRPSSASCPKK